MIPTNMQNAMKRISQIQKNIQSFMKPFSKANNKNTVKKGNFKQIINNRMNVNNNTNITAADKNSPAAKYDKIIKQASEKYGLPQSLIKAVIKVESNFNTRAVSKAGAMGLMQIMPVNFKNLGIKDPFNAEQNVMAGTRFLKELFNRFRDMDKALAAYNAGPNRVSKYGIPFKVKRNYVDLVNKYLKQYGGK